MKFSKLTRTHVRSFCALIAIFIVSAIQPANVDAGLFVLGDPFPPNNDSPFELRFSVGFDPAENSALTLPATNWLARIEMTATPATSGHPFGLWDATALVLHARNPHEGETLPPPILLRVMVPRAPEGGLGRIGQEILHPGGQHNDTYTFSVFIDDLTAAENNIVLTGNHPRLATDPVPEPTTLLLFGTTMAGLGLAARWRRRRQS